MLLPCIREVSEKRSQSQGLKPRRDGPWILGDKDARGFTFLFTLMLLPTPYWSVLTNPGRLSLAKVIIRRMIITTNNHVNGLPLMAEEECKEIRCTTSLGFGKGRSVWDSFL